MNAISIPNRKTHSEQRVDDLSVVMLIADQIKSRSEESIFNTINKLLCFILNDYICYHVNYLIHLIHLVKALKVSLLLFLVKTLHLFFFSERQTYCYI